MWRCPIDYLHMRSRNVSRVCSDTAEVPRPSEFKCRRGVFSTGTKLYKITDCDYGSMQQMDALKLPACRLISMEPWFGNPACLVQQHSAPVKHGDCAG